MQGYEDDMDDYGDPYVDEYEEEGEEDDEEGEDEQEEDRQPTKEELEYLELRQRLKESIRKKMKKEGGAARKFSAEKGKLPYNDFGSFFGPSQPVIASRVIQESKSLLENKELASRMLNSSRSSKKAVPSGSSASKNGLNEKRPKVFSEVKRKVEKLKDTRDYSFLFSDDAELPAPSKGPPSRSIPAPNSEARSAQLPAKPKQQLGNNGRNGHGGREEKKLASMNGHMHPRPGSSASGQMHSRSGSSASGQMHSRPGSSASGQMHSRPGSSASGQMHSRPGSSASAQMHSRPGSSASGQMHSRPGSSANGQMHSRPGSSANGQMHSRPGSSANGQMHSRTGSSANSQMRSKSGSQNSQVGSKSGNHISVAIRKPDLAPMDTRKQLGSNSGIGPGRPGATMSKAFPPKMPVSTMERKAPVSGSKNPLHSSQRPSSSKMVSSDPRQRFEQKKVSHEPSRSQTIPKQSAGPSKPQMSKPPLKQAPSRDAYDDHRPKKKPKMSEDDLALSMIRRMFKTDRFAGRDYDDDDSDMEANFEDIMREEKRSARIARKEDEEQLRLIEEEERQERMRKLAKKRKLSQH